MLFPTLLFFLHGLTYSQSPENVDLEKYLKQIEFLIDKNSSNEQVGFHEHELLDKRLNSDDIDKINVCLELYTNYIYKSTVLAKKYNDEATILAEKLNFNKGILQANFNQAYIYFIQGEFSEASKLLKSLQVNPNLNQLPEIHADCEILESYIFTERGEYDLALQNALDILEIGEDSKNGYIQMRAFSAISHVYLRLGEYKKAMENCLKGLDFILKLEKTQFLLPKIDELARMTHKLKGSREAAKLYDFYLRMEEKSPHAGSYINSIVYMNIANIYVEELKFEKAWVFLTKAMDIIDTNNYRFRKPRAYALMAELQLKTLDTIAAIDSYNKGLWSAEDINANDMVKDISNTLSTLFNLRKDSIKSTLFAKLYTKVSDSLFTMEASQRIKILESRRKINEISKEKEILEIKTKSQEDRYQFAILVLALTFISGTIATFSYFKVKKKNRLLFYRTKELTQEKRNHKKQTLPPSEEYSKAVDLDKRMKKKYIDDDLRDIIMTKLKRLEKANFFLNSNCSLSNLADELQTNQKYLSLVINHEKQSNFNTYINGLRIDYLLNRLLEDEEFRNSKLSYISTESGFNNPNTFYAAFKKRQGILPSYFIKQLNEEGKGEIMST